ncbi:peptidoglycan D,D-transpeptidase FtsI family protein [Pseudobacillus wudalianchiensis]|uniref:serine-type D-Ala-D-Ala carboxypeptidase n=1 Tax=Pseudobacillus wudalianchiensis TaxID=1743143 RepID=A0A1B9B8Z5_9BACI|nr:penicillin-binding protein 2 [Bacillus wudalianchiensis]OCA92542.1 penicillin-binding protein [Bacillus wudalianchiensis]
MVKKTKRKKKTHVPFRMNMMFFVVFLLFSILIFRLGIVQIVQGEDYQRKIERTEDVTVNASVPRGKIFDRNGQIVVDNVPQNAITYTRKKGATQEEMLETAEKLAKLIDKETDQVTERDKKDYWLIKNEEKAKKKITDKEWEKANENEISSKELYQMQLDRITEKDLKTLTKQDLEVLAIYREFTSGYAMTPQVVKNKNVSEEEYAVVSENLASLPGVNTTTDWDRAYAYDNTLKTVLGNISSSREGLPKEMVDFYLSRDYSRNDRVGKSYIEYQYEEVLRGQKTKVKNVTDKSGNILDSEVVREGQRGNDLVLTIDMDLQLAVEKIIEEELGQAKRQGGHPLLDRIFVTVMDPNTGEILTLAGKQFVVKDGKAEMRDFALGNLTTSYTMGSVVKGATVLTGYMTGAIHPGEYLVDEPLKFAGSGGKTKSSWFNRGGAMGISDQYALMRSSNVYMFKTAMKIGKAKYRPNGPLRISPETLPTMRRYFSQFGLGVRTGIDLPNEQVGFQGELTQPGLALDFAIGQFDTYTPLQLAQYVSTIANGGYRMKPHIVKEIRQPIAETGKIGPVVEEVEPQVLNRLDATPSEIKHVQEGFYAVMHGSQGTAKKYFAGVDYNPAGKTGTAEGLYDGPKREDYLKRGEQLPMTWNVNLVGYAPYDNPEVAFAVVVPWAYQHSANSAPLNNNVGRKVLDKYFELKAQRAKEETPDVVIEKDIRSRDSVEDEEKSTDSDNNEENTEEE